MTAQGFSNREIAQRLYLSHRTVESHLYRVFPKLGVTSRAQLAGVLGSRLGDRSERSRSGGGRKAVGSRKPARPEVRYNRAHVSQHRRTAPMAGLHREAPGFN